MLITVYIGCVFLLVICECDFVNMPCVRQFFLIKFGLVMGSCHNKYDLQFGKNRMAEVMLWNLDCFSYAEAIGKFLLGAGAREHICLVEWQRQRSRNLLFD